MRREYVTTRKAAATTTTIAINGGLKSTGDFDGADGLLTQEGAVGAVEGDGEGEGGDRTH